jgi:hypothetical protein
MVSAWATSTARIVWACAVRNCRRVGPDRRGAGSMSSALSGTRSAPSSSTRANSRNRGRIGCGGAGCGRDGPGPSGAAGCADTTSAQGGATADGLVDLCHGPLGLRSNQALHGGRTIFLSPRGVRETLLMDAYRWTRMGTMVHVSPQVNGHGRVLTSTDRQLRKTGWSFPPLRPRPRRARAPRPVREDLRRPAAGRGAARPGTHAGPMSRPMASRWPACTRSTIAPSATTTDNRVSGKAGEPHCANRVVTRKRCTGIATARASWSVLSAFG